MKMPNWKIRKIYYTIMAGACLLWCSAIESFSAEPDVVVVVQPKNVTNTISTKLARDPDGNFYLGWSSYVYGSDPDKPALELATFDTAGEELRRQTYSGGGGATLIGGLEWSSDQTLVFSTGGGGLIYNGQTISSQREQVVAKVKDPGGELRWVKNLGQFSPITNTHSLAVDGAGSTLVATRSEAGDNKVACVQKFDRDGTLLWRAEAATNLTENVTGEVVRTDSEESVYSISTLSTGSLWPNRLSQGPAAYLVEKKLLVAAACGANIVATRDDSFTEILPNYPYYAESSDRADVMIVVERAQSTFKGRMWNEGRKQLKALHDRYNETTMLQDFLRSVSQLN